MTQRLMLLDTATLYFRAYFAIPDSLKADDGTVVNALRGVLDFVSSLATQYEPDAIVACWDNDWRPAWRVELLSSYKAHRVVEESDGTEVEEAPDNLEKQVPLIAEALELLGVDVVGVDQFEADDVIGSYCHRSRGPVDVVTGDRDLFQVTDDDSDHRVLYTARGVRQHEVVTDDWIRAKYGIGAAQYVDFAALRGDPSDGLPGVRGIGDKTAAMLLIEFGDLDGITAAASDPESSLKPRARQALIEAADYLDAARQVITVRPDLEVPVPQRWSALTTEQRDKFVEFGKRWGLGQVTDRALAVPRPH